MDFLWVFPWISHLCPHRNIEKISQCVASVSATLESAAWEAWREIWIEWVMTPITGLNPYFKTSNIDLCHNPFNGSIKTSNLCNWIDLNHLQNYFLTPLSLLSLSHDPIPYWPPPSQVDWRAHSHLHSLLQHKFAANLQNDLWLLKNLNGGREQRS